MKIILGGFMVIIGMFVFGAVGMEQLISGGRLIDGTINLIIGSALTYIGFRKLGDNL